MTENILAVIPARGGSKGIPRKNILPIGGKPLIGHTISMALEARHVTRVVVSTDDPEIAAVAASFGADVIARPAELSGSFASSEAAVLHVLDELERTEGYCPEMTMLVQCTSPFTRAADLDNAVEALITEQADSALAVAPSHQFLWRRNADGAAEGINHEVGRRQMRQERTPEFVETGSFYVFLTAGFRQARHRFFGKTILVETPQDTHFELDEPGDVAIAEERFRARERQRMLASLPDTVSGIVFDFDGVLTDDRVLVDQDGVEAVRCSRSDGMGIERLRLAGMKMMVISKEANRVVAARCAKLSLPVEHGVEDKLTLLRHWLDREGIDAQGLVYVGNDVNDLACLGFAGCGVVPRDAHPQARAVADLILDADGGRGAVRLLSDLVLAAR